MYKVIANFMLKNNNSTLISEDVSQMINLSPNKQYFLMMYKYGFSNIFANVKQNLYISPNNSWIINSIPITETVITAPLVCDITYLIDKIKTATNNLIVPRLNEYGKIELTYDASVLTININSSDLGILATDFMGNFNTSITTTNLITSPNVPIISDFNYTVLTSNIVNSSSYIKTESNDKLTPTTAICSNSAALDPFQYVEYVSRTNVIFPITSSSIQRIEFQLLDENLNDLVLVRGAQTDFNVSFAIVEIF